MGTQAGGWGNSQQNADSALVGHRGCCVVEALEVHIPGGDGQPMADGKVVEQIGESVGVPVAVAQVVDQVGATGHQVSSRRRLVMASRYAGGTASVVKSLNMIWRSSTVSFQARATRASISTKCR